MTCPSEDPVQGEESDGMGSGVVYIESSGEQNKEV